MGQTEIIQLLKKYPKGLSCKEIAKQTNVYDWTARHCLNMMLKYHMIRKKYERRIIKDADDSRFTIRKNILVYLI